MNFSRWQELKGEIKDKFLVEAEGQEELAEGRGAKEFIVFTSPLDKLKLEFSRRPKVIDKKITYSNRIGSEVLVDYIYSDTEKIEQLLVYRWSEADKVWLPLEQELFS